VDTGRVQRRVRAVSTAVYGLCTHVHNRVYGRLWAFYTAVYKASYKAVHGRVHGRVRVVHTHKPCTRSCTLGMGPQSSYDRPM